MTICWQQLEGATPQTEILEVFAIGSLKLRYIYL